MEQELSREKIIFSTENPSHLLWQLHSLWQNVKIKAIERVANLTSLQYMVMVNIKWLINTKKEVTQIQLGEHLGMEPMNISQVLKILVSKGYVIRREHSLDTRAKAVLLTEEGEKVTDAATAEISEAEKIFFEVLGENLSRFTDDMSKLIIESSRFSE